MSEIIKLKNVTKKIGRNTILENINLTIHRGQSIAFMGHNGAGKSTMLKIIAKLSALTSGKIEYKDQLLVRYVPEHFPRTKLTTMQYLRLIGRIDGLSSEEREIRIRSLLKDFFMEPTSHLPLNHLSKGTLQKVGVIQALLMTPDVLLLDEPLSGQDMNSQSVFIQKMKELISNKTTIMMSCHENHLIDELSDTVIEVKDHQIELIDHQKRILFPMYCLTFMDERGNLKLPDLAFRIEKTKHGVKIYVDSSHTDAVIRKMMNQNWVLRGMHHEKSS